MFSVEPRHHPWNSHCEILHTKLQFPSPRLQLSHPEEGEMYPVRILSSPLPMPTC